MSVPDPVVWADRAEELVPWQFANLPGWVAFARAIAAGVQQLDDDAQDLLNTGISIATGDSLDQWGSLVSVPRSGMPDSDYRVLIRSKGYAVASSGSTPDVLLWASEVFGAENVELVTYPGFPIFRLIATDIRRTQGFRDEVRRQVNIAKPAGVQAVIDRVYPDDEAFTLAGAGGAGFGSGKLAGSI